MSFAGAKTSGFFRSPGALLRVVGISAAELLPLAVAQVEPFAITEIAGKPPLGISLPAAVAAAPDGRIFLAEAGGGSAADNRAHPERLADDLATATMEDRRKVSEKWRDPATGKPVAEAGNIRVLEDTNGDGKPDRERGFSDGGNESVGGTAPALLEYEGSFYVGQGTGIHLLTDADGDGRAERNEEIASGFGVRTSLGGHGIKGFTLGIDGRIWGAIGDCGLHLTTREGKTYALPGQGAVFRFDPDGSNFEIVHTGLRNPGKIAFDEFGNAFCVDEHSAQGDKTRLVYIVDGGDSGWEMEHEAVHLFHQEIGLAAAPPTRWMAENLWETYSLREPHTPEQPAWIVPPAGHLAGGASGLAYHPGTGFLASEAGRFLIPGNTASSAIRSFSARPDGAGMILADERELAGGIAAEDAVYTADGKILAMVSDGGRPPARGRLLVLDAGKNRWLPEESDSAARLLREGFHQRSSAELAVLLRHPDLRVRIQTQLALTRKPDGAKLLETAARSSDPRARIHGIRGLGVISRRGNAARPAEEFAPLPSKAARESAEATLAVLLESADEETRVQALRALMDASSPDAQSLPLGPLFGDASPRVLYSATVLAAKRDLIGYFGEICDMLAARGGKDPWLRHAGILALEAFGKNPNLLPSLRLHESETVRLAAVVALRRRQDGNLGLFLRDPSPAVSAEAIRAACDLDLPSFRHKAAALLGDAEFTRKLAPFMQRRLLAAAFRSGGLENAARLFSYAADSGFPAENRAEALRWISSWENPFPVNQFTGHWSPLPDRPAAEVKAALASALPKLLASDAEILGKTLGLVRRIEPTTAEISDERLRGFIGNPELLPTARAAAIELMISRNPPDLPAVLRAFSGDSTDEIAFAASAEMLRRAPEKAPEILAPVFQAGRIKLAQQLIASVREREHPAISAVLRGQLAEITRADGKSPLALDILAWAGASSDPAIAADLRAYRERTAENPDPLAEFFPLMQGGDPAAGAEIFAASPAGDCRRCHSAGESAENTGLQGGDAAPRLAGGAKPRDFLESLLKPGARISPGHATISLTLKNSAHLAGRWFGATSEYVDVETAGKRFRIRKSDIATETTPVSLMPPAGDTTLKLADIRDLIAWLGMLKPAAPPAETPADFPFLDPATLVTTAPAAAPLDPAVMAAGKTQYITCAACHGQQGEGTGAAPPLARSEWIAGDPANLIRIQLRGLRGPISVAGVNYDFPAGMAPLAYQSDEQIAAVLTFIRNSFGNSAPAISPAEVKALRGEVGKPPLTVADLAPPGKPPAGNSADAGAYNEAESPFVTKLWIFLGGALAITVLCFLMKRSGTSAG